jgi:hypothetical protein
MMIFINIIYSLKKYIVTLLSVKFLIKIILYPIFIIIKFVLALFQISKILTILRVKKKLY